LLLVIPIHTLALDKITQELYTFKFTVSKSILNLNCAILFHLKQNWSSATIIYRFSHTCHHRGYAELRLHVGYHGPLERNDRVYGRLMRVCPRRLTAVTMPGITWRQRGGGRSKVNSYATILKGGTSHCLLETGFLTLSTKSMWRGESHGTV